MCFVVPGIYFKFVTISTCSGFLTTYSGFSWDTPQVFPMYYCDTPQVFQVLLHRTSGVPVFFRTLQVFRDKPEVSQFSRNILRAFQKLFKYYCDALEVNHRKNETHVLVPQKYARHTSGFPSFLTTHLVLVCSDEVLSLLVHIRSSRTPKI